MKTPLPYQKQILRRIDQLKGRCLLAADMGLGKTPIALWWMRKRDALPAIVVCPATIKFHWQREAESLRLQVEVLEGEKPKGLNGDVFVINYDILPFWADDLLRTNPQILVIDECQNIANPQARRTKAVKFLSREIPRILALSGTPLLNRPIELWETIHLIDPKAWLSRLKYATKFCNLKIGYGGRLDYSGAKNLKQLHQKLLDTVMIRCRKRDVMPELGEKQRHLIPLPMRHPEKYHEADAETRSQLRRPGKGAKMQAMVRLGHLKRLAAKLKFPSVVEWIRGWMESNDGKLIVFAWHRKMIQALTRRCQEFYPVVVEGSTSQPKRKSAVDRFQTDNRVRLFIGNIKAAGAGLTLTAASTVAFAELSWVPGLVFQAEDRPHRIGQTETCDVYYLVARGTVEEKVAEILQRKEKVLAGVLDGGEGAGELSVFNELKRTFLK